MKLLFLEIKLENKSIAKIQIIFGTKKLFGKKLLKKLLGPAVTRAPSTHLTTNEEVFLFFCCYRTAFFLFLFIFIVVPVSVMVLLLYLALALGEVRILRLKFLQVLPVLVHHTIVINQDGSGTQVGV